MQRLRFINSLAKITEVTVDAVNDGMPLVFNEIYTVSDELADKLVVNEDDWRRLSPPRDKSEEETAELPIVVAETEGANEQ